MAEDLNDYINRIHGALEEIIQGAEYNLKVANQRIFEIELQLESERSNNKELQRKIAQDSDTPNHVVDEELQSQVREYQAREKDLKEEIELLQSKLEELESSREKDREDIQLVLTEFKGMLEQI